MQKTLLAIIAAAVVAVGLTVNFAVATHEPADKAVVAGDDMESTSANEPAIEVLRERMRVSSSTDLVLQLTSECSILTSLLTGNDDTGGVDSAFAFGQVKMFITVDGNRVPVATNDSPGTVQNPDDDFGEVVFCNRAYQRSVANSESASDGVDTEDDFIRTRTANAFNWLALNAGDDATYDTSTTNGNNIVDVVVHAEFTKEPKACTTPGGDDSPTAMTDTCAEALIGSRTLIIEPTQASVHELANPTANTGS